MWYHASTSPVPLAITANRVGRFGRDRHKVRKPLSTMPNHLVILVPNVLNPVASNRPLARDCGVHEWSFPRAARWQRNHYIRPNDVVGAQCGP